MFKINNENKPNAKYRVILSTAETPDVTYSTTRALQLLEDQINKLAEDSITSNRKLAVTLIGTANISVTSVKDGVMKYIVTASQSVLIEITEAE